MCTAHIALVVKIYRSSHIAQIRKSVVITFSIDVINIMKWP